MNPSMDSTCASWHVPPVIRLCRRRFWKGEYNEDKISAYQTLYTCLETLMKLIAPIAPFFSEQIFKALNEVSGKEKVQSIHLTDFPVACEDIIDNELEEQMRRAQEISSLILSLRKRNTLKVRQPLSKVMIPVADTHMQQQIENVKHLILAETNIKDIAFLHSDNNILTKKIKPNFKTLGPKYGKIMKAISAEIQNFSQQQINALEAQGKCDLTIEGQPVEILLSDVEIATQDIPGWVVANEGSLTVALDITLTEELKAEGIARELVNRIQNIRKEGFEVTDRIRVQLLHGEWDAAVAAHKEYICNEVLCTELSLVDSISEGQAIEIIEGVPTQITVMKA